MLAILYRLCVEEVTEANIHIFRHATPGVGEAYKFSPDHLIMNTRNDAVTFFDEIIHYRNWIEIHFPQFSAENSFPPRRVFGQYLVAVRSIVLSRLERSLCRIQYHDSATHIGPAGEVCGREKSPLYVDITFVSIGFGEIQNYSNLTRVLDKTPNGGLLYVAGSGLSAIDAIVLCNHLRPDVTIECFSQQGRFPAVRGDFSPSSNSIFSLHPNLLKQPCVFNLLRAIRTECDEFRTTSRDDYELLISPRLSLEDPLCHDSCPVS